MMQQMIVSSVVAMGLAASAGAAIVQYSANMDGASEFPPVVTPGTGFALVTIDTTLNTMRVQANFTGLIGNTTAAHIHAATAVAGTGTAGVATQTPSFSGFPLGVTSGSMDTTFDMTLNSSFNASFITNNGGTPATARAALYQAMADGKAYFNIHSSFVGSGEIRGFLTLVPAPGTGALLAMGGLMMARRRR